MILILTTLFSCIGAGAFAASMSTVKQYGQVDPKTGKSGILVLGDSVGRGCGVNPDETEYYDYAGCRYVAGSYPAIVADAVGCEGTEVAQLIGGNTSSYGQSNFWPVCFPGMSLHCAMQLMGLDDGFEDKYYEEYFDGTRIKAEKIYKNPEHPEMYIDNLIKDVRLVVIELGMIDYAYRAMIVANYERGNYASPEAISTEPEFLADVLKYCYEGFEYIKSVYPLLIQHIQHLNPDAEIAILNSFSLATNMSLIEGTVTPLGDALWPIAFQLNYYFEKWAKELGCYYVDISAVETPGNYSAIAVTSDEFKNNSRIMTHPSPEGYEYIARQIFAALPENQEIDEPQVDPVCPLIIRRNTDIVVDIGRYTKVNYVKVDNKTIKNWSFGDPETGNPHELTVPFSNKRAKLMTVCMVVDGKLVTQIYQLSYKNDHYKAYLMYSTPDTAKTATTFVGNVFSVGSKILKTFAGLFKK